MLISVLMLAAVLVAVITTAVTLAGFKPMVERTP